MKLSKDTISIIKNFSTINSNLTIKAGSTLTTISSGKNIIAQATVAEDFPSDFAIYDLNEFLGAMSLFDSPEIEFEDKFATIHEGKNSVQYYAANPSILTPIPNIKPFPKPDIEFNMSSQALAQIQKVSSILRVSDFIVHGNGDDISFVVGDKSNPTGNIFKSVCGQTDKVFKVSFKVENLKMLPGDYKVSIGGKKISRFVSANGSLTYYAAIELDSTFDF